jgi:hypothetical protein
MDMHDIHTGFIEAASAFGLPEPRLINYGDSHKPETDYGMFVVVELPGASVGTRTFHGLTLEVGMVYDGLFMAGNTPRWRPSAQIIDRNSIMRRVVGSHREMHPHMDVGGIMCCDRAGLTRLVRDRHFVKAISKAIAMIGSVNTADAYRHVLGTVICKTCESDLGRGSTYSCQKCRDMFCRTHIPSRCFICSNRICDRCATTHSEYETVKYCPRHTVPNIYVCPQCDEPRHPARKERCAGCGNDICTLCRKYCQIGRKDCQYGALCNECAQNTEGPGVGGRWACKNCVPLATDGKICAGTSCPLPDLPKPLSHFTRDGRTTDGFSKYCNLCRSRRLAQARSARRVRIVSRRRTILDVQDTSTTQGDTSTWVDELASQQEEPVPF